MDDAYLTCGAYIISDSAKFTFVAWEIQQNNLLIIASSGHWQAQLEWTKRNQNWPHQS
jgi:hypothetical protein